MNGRGPLWQAHRSLSRITSQAREMHRRYPFTRTRSAANSLRVDAGEMDDRYAAGFADGVEYGRWLERGAAT